MVFDLLKKRQAQREEYGERLPPHQRLTRPDEWPVLHYGAPPRADLATWTFRMWGLVEGDVELSWNELNAISSVEMRNDIHCVTGWSKFDNNWAGVPVLEVLNRVQLKPEATAVMVHSYGGYTTNLLLEDLARPENLLAHTHNGQPLAKEHGGPMRLVVPHLYFWKSAKWVRGFEFIAKDQPGFWEMYGYHMRGDPWAEERYG
jgi:DMSO/TMAO reductase YedYZ molybdopterin-dependent catalytic subunit